MKYKITVEFCQQWNFAPKAASFAEELFNHFRANIENLNLVASSGGAFEVTVNGEKLYSKIETGSFPETENIIAQMEKMK